MSRNRIKRRIAEAAGWLCLLAVVLVVAAMESGVLRPITAAGAGLGLEAAAALLLAKGGVIRIE
jgi:hypothetical protein